MRFYIILLITCRIKLLDEVIKVCLRESWLTWLSGGLLLLPTWCQLNVENVRKHRASLQISIISHAYRDSIQWGVGQVVVGKFPKCGLTKNVRGSGSSNIQLNYNSIKGKARESELLRGRGKSFIKKMHIKQLWVGVSTKIYTLCHIHWKRSSKILRWPWTRSNYVRE